LKESARRAAEFGVTLCVQNHHDIAAHYESMFNLLIEIDEPNCQAALDAWSLALHGTDLVAAPPLPQRGRGVGGEGRIISRKAAKGAKKIAEPR
jgi:hypothetical protein